jgi:hypothetical protein
MAKHTFKWDPLDPTDPGPCIDVIISNSRYVIDAGSPIGLEYPEGRPIRALLDTGASVTVVSNVFAKHCKLFQTNAGVEIRGINSVRRCPEFAGAISFPGTRLRSFDPIRINSVDFVREPHFACLIGRDIMQNWTVTFDGKAKVVTIID